MRSVGAAARCRRSTNRASRCALPQKRSARDSHSTLASPELLRRPITEEAADVQFKRRAPLAKGHRRPSACSANAPASEAPAERTGYSRSGRLHQGRDTPICRRERVQSQLRGVRQNRSRRRRGNDTFLPETESRALYHQFALRSLLDSPNPRQNAPLDVYEKTVRKDV
jgi:hypothetical protein